jgi:hypothetical protein
LSVAKNLLCGGDGEKQVPFDFAQGRLSAAKNAASRMTTGLEEVAKATDTSQSAMLEPAA